MKHDLSDITFIIPFPIDCPERDENLKFIINFLSLNFKTNILLIEESESPTPQYYRAERECFIKYFWISPHFKDVFYRTKVINKGIKLAKTPYIAIYDTDVFFKINNYLKAYETLKNNAALVYPYGGKFVDIARHYIKDGTIEESESFADGSYGGCVFADRKKYIACGMENENIVSWGPEDVERHDRMLKLGNSVVRIEGTCYHLKHPAGGNSNTQNPYWKANIEEYDKVAGMSGEELKEYIKTWEWLR